MPVSVETNSYFFLILLKLLDEVFFRNIDFIKFSENSRGSKKDKENLEAYAIKWALISRLLGYLSLGNTVEPTTAWAEDRVSQ